MGTIRILVVGDQTIERQGLKALIENEAGLSVVGELSSDDGVCELATRLKPQVVVVLDGVPRLGTLKATRNTRVAAPETAVLVLSTREEMEHLQELLRAGANGYVLKRSGAEVLFKSIRSVAFGDTYLDPGLAAQVAQQASNRRYTGDGLSSRESEVCKRIAQGYSNKEVAAHLDLSVKTIETYKARSMEKLRLGSRVDLIRYALQHGWLDELTP